MKKKLALSFFLFAFHLQLFSQKSDLPVDEYGKYTFYEIVDAVDHDSVTLLNNAESFLNYYVNKKSRHTIKRENNPGKVLANSSFLVYKKGSLGKNVDGSIEYSIIIEVKDQKYRYVLSDFLFQEYERDRYGKFVPVAGKIVPLEKPSSKLNEWQWEAHRETVSEKMELLIGELKLDMLKVANSKAGKKSKKDW